MVSSLCEALIWQGAQILLKEIQVAGGTIVIAGDRIGRQLATTDGTLDQLILILCSVVGVVPRQQSKLHARRQVMIHLADQVEKIPVVLILPACDMQIAEMDPRNNVFHS